MDLSITHLVINGILGGPILLPNATTSRGTERHVLKGAKSNNQYTVPYKKQD